jgi:predicted metal-dependent hydrolase
MKITISEIFRSHRRTIALIITPDARLIVRAPLRAKMAEIESLVEQKRNWITKKLLQADKKQNIHTLNPFTNGELFRYKGQQYPLVITSGERSIRLNEHELLFPDRFMHSPEHALVHWYVREMLRYAEERVNFYTNRYGFTHTGISITGARRRWGSCSHANRLCFSWRLILLPEHVIDYVVVHELCHTVEKNHSRAFWEKVETVMPDYKASRALLKQY